MSRRLTAVALGAAATLAVAGPAGAHGEGAKVYRTTLDGTASGEEDVRGRVQFVDGRRKDILIFHIRGLQPGEPYTVALNSSDGDDPCTDAKAREVAGWTKTKDANAAGNLNGRLRRHLRPEKETTSEKEATYYVTVQDEAGKVVACGELERRVRHGRRAEDDRRDRRRAEEDRRERREDRKQARGPKGDEGAER